MKIVYLTNQLYLHGGIEKILAQKINYWIEVYGYQVVLCTTEQKNNSFVYPINNKVKHIDLEINYFRNKSYFHPKNMGKSITHYKALCNLLEEEQPNVVVSVNYTPEQFLLPFIARHIPKVKEFHSSGVTFKKPKSLAEKLKYRLFMLFGKYDALVVLNEDERKYYPFSNIYVIPNFLALPKEEQVINKENTIIAAGRIAPVKQFDHLIQAWSLIADEHPDWQLKIFGDGDAVISAKLQQQIDNLQVFNCLLMGATSKLDEEMHKASLYAMTSATECFPMVLLEAQAAGLPIVSYDCPNGPRHIVTKEVNGMLTPTNEIAIFAEAINKLIHNKGLRELMGNTARQSVKTYSQESVMLQWQNLFTTYMHK